MRSLILLTLTAFVLLAVARSARASLFKQVLTDLEDTNTDPSSYKEMLPKSVQIASSLAAWGREGFKVLRESTPAADWYGLPMQTVKEVQFETHPLDTDDVSLFLEKKLWNNRKEPLLLKGCPYVKEWPISQGGWPGFIQHFDADRANFPLKVMNLKQGHIKVHHSESDRPLPSNLVIPHELGVTMAGEELEEVTPNYVHDNLSSMAAFYALISPGRVNEAGEPLTRDDDQWLVAVDLADEPQFASYFKPDLWSVVGASMGVNVVNFLEHPQQLAQMKADSRLKVQRMWVGGRNMTAVAHFDTPANLYVQVLGKKTWVMWNPDLLWSFYMHGAGTQSWRHSVLDVEQWETLGATKQFELLRLLHEEAGWVVTLEPGDVLYVPEMFFHTVIARETSLSVNWFLNDHTKRAQVAVMEKAREYLGAYPYIGQPESYETRRMNMCHSLQTLYWLIDAMWAGPNNPVYHQKYPRRYDTVSSLKLSSSRMNKQWVGLSQHNSPKVLDFLELVHSSLYAPAQGHPRPGSEADMAMRSLRQMCASEVVLPQHFLPFLEAVTRTMEGVKKSTLEILLVDTVGELLASVGVSRIGFLLEGWILVVEENIRRG